MVARRRRKVKNLSFILILYLNQQSNVLQCFCSLKFEKRLFSNTFSVLYFTVRWHSWKRIHAAEKDQVEHFA